MKILGTHELAEFYFKDTKGYVVYYLGEDDPCISTLFLKMKNILDEILNMKFILFIKY